MVNIRSVFTFACVALVASVSANSDEHRTLQAVNFRQDLLDAINAVRKTEGLKPMCINEMLMDAAQIQSNDMADSNFIKSTGSDGSTPKQRAADQGFKAAEVTEVVGAGYRTASSIVAAWAKSATAKSTLFSKHNVMGPGYTFDKTRKYVHFWAVDFATGACGSGAPAADPAGSSSGTGTGSVEFPGSAPASDNDSDEDSGSADTPAVTPAPAGSGSEAPASGSRADPPAPAPSGSEEDDSASGSDDPPATPAAGTPAPAAGTPAPAAGTPAPAGSEDEDPESGSDDPPAAAPAAATPAAAPAAATPAAAPAAATPAAAPAAATPAAAPAGTPVPAAGTPAPPSGSGAPAAPAAQ
ncbi:unnamed protein product [Phytophthora fragariaefolia]|uniref:Unnamed protein product n=1 Tax=Phytophthora fragariaefolia TaxID=1490495 RepID=A0A9W6YDP3_9STRA|nr:unnamed protein product [Phytophthora fragariaefolia]